MIKLKTEISADVIISLSAKSDNECIGILYDEICVARIRRSTGELWTTTISEQEKLYLEKRGIEITSLPMINRYVIKDISEHKN